MTIPFNPREALAQIDRRQAEADKLAERVTGVSGKVLRGHIGSFTEPHSVAEYNVRLKAAITELEARGKIVEYDGFSHTVVSHEPSNWSPTGWARFVEIENAGLAEMELLVLTLQAEERKEHEAELSRQRAAEDRERLARELEADAPVSRAEYNALLKRIEELEN
jgi:hypothetical protein